MCTAKICQDQIGKDRSTIEMERDKRDPPVNRILDHLQARGSRLSKVTYAHRYSRIHNYMIERSEAKMVCGKEDV